MQDNKKDKEEEKLTDLKGSLESFIKEELPELSQEEAIKAYTEGPKKPKKRKNANSDDDESEDDDHLRRLKQELLASLERVNKLAKQLFGEKEFSGIKNINVKKEYQKAISKDKNLEQVKSKEQTGIERSREE